MKYVVILFKRKGADSVVNVTYVWKNNHDVVCKVAYVGRFVIYIKQSIYSGFY